MTIKQELILDLESMEGYLDMTGYEEQFGLVPNYLKIGDVLLWPEQMAVIEQAKVDSYQPGFSAILLGFRVKIMFIRPAGGDLFTYLYLRISNFGILRLKPTEDLRSKIRVFRKVL